MSRFRLTDNDRLTRRGNFVFYGALVLIILGTSEFDPFGNWWLDTALGAVIAIVLTVLIMAAIRAADRIRSQHDDETS